MNRQFRRAQEKQDKRQEKEKTRRREERKAKVRQLRQARRQRSEKSKPREAGTTTGEADTPQRPATRGRVPGRFAGVLAAVTVFFISLQGAAPAEQQQEGWGASLIYAGFYLMLGYFSTLWFMRRDSARAPLVGVVGGILLAATVTVVQLVQDRPVDLLALALVVPALVLGALLGRLVFLATPR